MSEAPAPGLIVATVDASSPRARVGVAATLRLTAIRSGLVAFAGAASLAVIGDLTVQDLLAAVVLAPLFVAAVAPAAVVERVAAVRPASGARALAAAAGALAVTLAAIVAAVVLVTYAERALGAGGDPGVGVAAAVARIAAIGREPAPVVTFSLVAALPAAIITGARVARASRAWQPLGLLVAAPLVTVWTSLGTASFGSDPFTAMSLGAGILAAGLPIFLLTEVADWIDDALRRRAA